MRSWNAGAGTLTAWSASMSSNTRSCTRAARNRATFGVRYSMDFHWRDGKVTRERNINECYNVRRLPDEDRWGIIRNDDYQHRICSP